jgi:group I intron endonuclease
MKIGIYKITSPTNRIYIGQSIDIDRRFRFYKNINCKGQPLLYKSLLKYGPDKHLFEIIELCDFSELNIKERFWQDYYDVLNGGLNCNLTETNILPKKHSEETKLKISNSNKGKTFSEETKLKLSKIKKETTLGSNNNFYNKKHSEKSLILMAKIKSGANNPNAKIVLNLETGIFYESTIEAAESTTFIGFKYLRRVLSGARINKTPFIYV